MRPSTIAGFLVTAAIAIFLIGPAVLSIAAGLSVNYARGITSGLTVAWLHEVWIAYADTVVRSILIALGTLAVTLVVGVPAAWALARQPRRIAHVIEEVVTLPVSVPGLAFALALLIAHGSVGVFRSSSLFIVVGHVLYTLPFMLRSVSAVLASLDWRSLDEGAATLGASSWRRFVDVIIPAVRPGILAGALTVVTLSIGEFNLTWMLHTPLTKTLPVGLADAYASLRLEIASAYTLLFFVMIVPLLVGLQWAATAADRVGRES